MKKESGEYLKKFTQVVLSTIIAVSTINVFSINKLDISAEIIANPIISRDCPAYSESNPYTASSGNDAFYYSFWFGTSPDYLAYDLSAVPESQRKTVIAAWYNTTGQYDYTVLNSGSSGMPSDYTIEVNAADGGEYPKDGWVVSATVKENTLHSRQHVVDMEGYNWIRIMITGSDGKEGGTSSINFDIHNASEGVADSWIFLGDSITAGGMWNCYGTGYAELINQIDERYFPVQENGGIGGIFSTDGANNIDKWLESFPGEYVSVAYGTNDAWGNQTGAEKYYENTAYMVEKIIESGKIPIIPKIPYATESGVSNYLSDYNEMIDKIYDTYSEVIKGPDFEKLFYENPELLSADGVHPSNDGYIAMRELWAETMYNTVYLAENDEFIIGDINADKIVDEKDAKLLSEYLLNNNTLDNYKNVQKTADLNGDKQINSLDLISMKNIIVKK